MARLHLYPVGDVALDVHRPGNARLGIVIATLLLVVTAGCDGQATQTIRPFSLSFRPSPATQAPATSDINSLIALVAGSNGAPASSTPVGRNALENLANAPT